MTKLIAPKAGEKCNDLACGTFGFMIAADQHIKQNTKSRLKYLKLGLGVINQMLF